MAKLKSGDIAAEVRDVLLSAKSYQGEVAYLTPYQILARLPEATRKQLIQDHGRGGKGANRQHTAVSVVSKAADNLPDIENKTWLETTNLLVPMEQKMVSAGSPISRVYRLKR
jgi:hypothetical protein